MTQTTDRMPVIFLAHGSPMSLEDANWRESLGTWMGSFAKPRAILMLSAHWVSAPTVIGAKRTVPLVYDFYGFPAHYYQIQYASPGAPELAARVASLLAPLGGVAQSERGLDHGAFVPLLGMYPAADVPVLQVSLPSEDPQTLWRMGEALAPLRDEGVLIVGSGFLTHNLRIADWRSNPPVPEWAREFDAWSKETLLRRDQDALLDYRERAPGVRIALPTHEHFVPIIPVMAASRADDAIRFPIEGFAFGGFTMRSVQFG